MPFVDLREGPLRFWKIMQIRFENGTEIAALLKTAFEAIWTPPGRLLASILDHVGPIVASIFDPEIVLERV